MSPAIELKNIEKTFVERSWRTVVFPEKPKKVRALKDVSLEIQTGEIFGLLGPNGAGKTRKYKITSKKSIYLFLIIDPFIAVLKVFKGLCEILLANHKTSYKSKI